MSKKRFDINDYKGDYCMHCDTEEKAKVFLKYLDSVGKTWFTRQSYLSHNNWESSGTQSCYSFNKGTYGDLNSYCLHGFEILEFDDFYWGEENSPKEDSIQEALQKVEEEKTPLGWTPEKGEKYWQVLSNGRAFSYRNDREVDIDIFKHTRVFKTKEEAEFEREKIKVTRELEKYAKEFKKGGFNYYIYVDRTEMAINFSCRETIQWQGLCFESVKKAKEAIKAVGEDRILKYYFGVENE